MQLKLVDPLGIIFLLLSVSLVAFLVAHAITFSFVDLLPGVHDFNSFVLGRGGKSHFVIAVAGPALGAALSPLFVSFDFVEAETGMLLHVTDSFLEGIRLKFFNHMTGLAVVGHGGKELLEDILALNPLLLLCPQPCHRPRHHLKVHLHL